MPNPPPSTSRAMTPHQRSLASTLPANFGHDPLFTARPGQPLGSTPLGHTSDFDERELIEALRARRAAGSQQANRGGLANQPNRVTRRPPTSRANQRRTPVQTPRPYQQANGRTHASTMAVPSFFSSSFAYPTQQYPYPQQPGHVQPQGFVFDPAEMGLDISMWTSTNTNAAAGSSIQYPSHTFGQQWPLPPATNAASRPRLTPQSSTTFSSTRYPGNPGSRQTAYPPTSRGQ